MRILLAALVISGCTANEVAKDWGGTAVTKLDPGMKLVNVTWKNGADLWYLVRPMRPGEVPEKYEFQEDSSMGILNGKVIIQERAPAFP